MITLKDLAEKLEVSVSTVSKALNGSHEISENTVARVKALAEYYNYKPNKIALSLKQNRTQTIGVIVPDILNRFFAKVLYGIENEASKRGFSIITCMSNESLEKERQSLQVLADGSVDGFILAISEETQVQKDYSHFTSITESSVPMVMFDRVLDDVPCDKVIINDSEAIEQTVDALIKKGRKHIAFVSTLGNLNVGQLREAGYKKALQEGGLTQAPLVLDISDGNLQDAIRNFLSAHSDIDAVVAADNRSGTTCVNVAIGMGYDIPKDISIVAFSDATLSDLSVPRLAYIEQDAEEMGRRALSLIVDRIEGTNEGQPFVVDQIATKVVERESL